MQSGFNAFPKGPRAWQNVLAQRAIGTIYTNNNDHEIQVCIGIRVRSAGNGGNQALFYLNGILAGSVSNINDQVDGIFNAIIPIGTIYQVTGNGDSLISWLELI